MADNTETSAMQDQPQIAATGGEPAQNFGLQNVTSETAHARDVMEDDSNAPDTESQHTAAQDSNSQHTTTQETANRDTTVQPSLDTHAANTYDTPIAGVAIHGNPASLVPASGLVSLRMRPADPTLRVAFLDQLPPQMTGDDGQVIIGIQNTYQYLIVQRGLDVDDYIHNHLYDSGRTILDTTKVSKIRALLDQVVIVSNATVVLSLSRNDVNCLVDTQASALYEQERLTCWNAAGQPSIGLDDIHTQTEYVLGDCLTSLLIQVEQVTGSFSKDEYTSVFSEPLIHTALYKLFSVALKLRHKNNPAHAEEAIHQDMDRNFASCLELKADILRREIPEEWRRVAIVRNEAWIRSQHGALPYYGNLDVRGL